MTERQAGYYWVQCTCGEWDVALWMADCWTICGTERMHQDRHFVHIGPRVPDYVEPTAAADTQDDLFCEGDLEHAGKPTRPLRRVPLESQDGRPSPDKQGDAT